MRAMTIAAALLTLTSAAVPSASLRAAEAPGAGAWEIGPIIRGRNYSVGMPLSPTPARRGWSFDFPTADTGHVHYLTFRHGPLTGKNRIVMRYRIDAPRGTRFVPQQWPQQTALVSLYFQRSGDNWSGRGRFDGYRWYAPFSTAVPLSPGEHVLSVPLDNAWGGVNTFMAATHPQQFQDALDNADRVGFVLGSVNGRGHGVYATAPARFTVLSFQVI